MTLDLTGWRLRKWLNKPSTQLAILKVLKNATGPMRTKDIIQKCGKKGIIVRKALSRLVDKELVIAEIYEIPTSGGIPKPGYWKKRLYSINREKLK